MQRTGLEIRQEAIGVETLPGSSAYVHELNWWSLYGKLYVDERVVRYLWKIDDDCRTGEIRSGNNQIQDVPVCVSRADHRLYQESQHFLCVHIRLIVDFDVEITRDNDVVIVRCQGFKYVG